MGINKKIVYAIDLFLIVGTLLGVLYLVGYTRPLVIAPIDGLSTSNSSILFEFEKGSVILMDDNPEFSSPEKIYAENNLVINLNPGKYYWKISGIGQSEVRTLTINSQIDLKLKESGEKIVVVNSGNEELNVDVYNNETKVGNFILSREESQNVSGDKVVGGLNG